MSLILDALKKSEQQRQREKAPSLQSIHQPVPVVLRRSTRPWWALGVCIVVGNLAFFGYWLWRQQNPVSGTASPAPVATQPAPATAKAAAPAAAQPGEGASAETARPAAGGGAERVAQPESAQPEFTRISPHTEAESEPAETSQPIEEIGELPEKVRNDLPAMTFSFHIYSENPEQRTIIINDRRMREGDDISPGLRLQGITKDGVILLFEHHRIHISVLSEW